MRNFHFPGRSEVYAKNAMVATSQPLATETALSIMKQGGNAMDAAIAAAAVLAVIEPTDTGIGGDCFALFSEGSKSAPIAFNGSGKSPANISIDKIKKLNLNFISDHSPHAVTIPGAVDAWHQLHQRFCNLDFEELLAPAINFAEDGYFVHERLSNTWRNNLNRLQNTEAKLLFSINGVAPSPGQKMKNTFLAKTLKTISKLGRKGFYEGEISTKIVSYLRSKGGHHTLEDFASAKGEFVSPINTNYREKTVFQLPPNTQGIISLIILKILEHFKLSKLKFNDPERIHILIEAAKISYFYRNKLLGDLNSSKKILNILNNDDLISTLASDINLKQSNTHIPSIPNLGSNTVYLSVIDKDLNSVSFINSLYESFGTGISVPSLGILLQNRGKSFTLDENHPNHLGPSKRPMHTIIPAMVFNKEKLFMSFGVMGGDYQPMGHVDVLSCILDHGLNFQSALDKPRFLPINQNVEVEEGVSAEIINNLKSKNHNILKTKYPHGGGQIISIDWNEGKLIGASDPRKDGIALGY
tara:strand:- start:3205 stop:4788 length:1584 start_codon:yes stop_codon:yes gene_type:complete